MDVLHALQFDLFKRQCDIDRYRDLHNRVLVDSDRVELHRHDSHDARARANLVPLAVVHLVALRDELDHDPRNSGDRGDGASACA